MSKPLSLIIEHTVETLDGLTVARRIELLEALHELAVSRDERALLRGQIVDLRSAEANQAQLLLDLRTIRARRAA